MNLLNAKEDRVRQIRQMVDKDHGLIVIGSNIPGKKKNTGYTELLIHYFARVTASLFLISKSSELKSEAGNLILLQTNKDRQVKEQLIKLEDSHPLGRFVDLDYFCEEEKSISRSDLGYPLRKCFLCEKPAFVCIREENHSKRVILAHFNKQTETFFTPQFKDIIKNAIMGELDLEDKFGLVTPTSSGSHPDMDYALMKRVAFALLDDFVHFIWLGMKYSVPRAYQKANKLGLKMEAKMFAVTGGINAYKGLIFLAGFILVGFGKMLSTAKEWQDLPGIIQRLSRDILQDLQKDTFGEKLIHEKAIYGARGEVKEGIPTVLAIKNDLEKQGVDEVSLHLALIKSIGLTHDTVFIKRSGSWTNYLNFREKITAITAYDRNRIAEVTKECIASHISCGGAADILIGALLVLGLSKIYPWRG